MSFRVVSNLNRDIVIFQLEWKYSGLFEVGIENAWDRISSRRRSRRREGNQWYMCVWDRRGKRGIEKGNFDLIKSISLGVFCFFSLSLCISFWRKELKNWEGRWMTGLQREKNWEGNEGGWCWKKKRNR